MNLSTNPYKGSRDFYPQDQAIQNYIFDKFKQVLKQFCYQEYNGPMLEPFDLYAAKSGQELVQKQLYHFVDQGDRKLAIRPEMTPTLARMVAGKLRELPKPIRWFSIPNLWRYERPQRGRLREHWQLNVDLLGGKDPVAVNVEVLQIALEIFKSFNGLNFVQIKINHRKIINQFFVDCLKLNDAQALELIKLTDAKLKLSEDIWQQKLKEILVTEEKINTFEKFINTKSVDQLKQFNINKDVLNQLQQTLDLLAQLGFQDQIAFDPAIMRGLDYYTGMVFEAFDISPENNRALFGGGCYENLVGMFGKETTPGVGFGLGDVTIFNFLETHKLLPSLIEKIDIYFILLNEKCLPIANKLMAKLRVDGKNVACSLNYAPLSKQLKKLDKNTIENIAVIGEAELEKGVFLLKNLQSDSQQEIKF